MKLATYRNYRRSWRAKTPILRPLPAAAKARLGLLKGNQCLVMDAAGRPKAVITVDAATGERTRRGIRA